MPADRKATSKQLLELWGDNAADKAADFLSADYVNHQMPDAAGGTSSKSLEQWKALVSDFHQGFSNVQMDILLQVAEGDYVCTRWRLTATNTGAFRDAESTGKTTSWTGVHTDRYEDDKLGRMGYGHVSPWPGPDKLTTPEWTRSLTYISS